MPDKKITINCVGLDDRSVVRLQNALKKNVRNILLAMDQADPDLVLVNLNTSDAVKSYKECIDKYPLIPTIGISKNKVSNSGMRVLSMPVDIDELIKTIKEELPDVDCDASQPNRITDDKVARAMAAVESRKVAEKLNKRVVPERKGISGSRSIPTVKDEMCFDINRFMLGVMLQVIDTLKQDKTAALINCWREKIILVEYERGLIWTDLNDSQIRNMAIATIEGTFDQGEHIKYMNSSEVAGLLKTEFSSTRKVPLEVFMWDLAVLTCKGRIPIDSSISEKQFLRRWPNITRMKLSENAMKIISYWVKQPCDINELKEKLDVPLQDVFSVYTAAFSAGLAGKAKRQSDELVQAEDLRVNEKRGTFNSIVSRLRKMYRDVA
ncbi:MAG: hypothetical protein SV201_07760 [Pseudomonadota bacterium]|nr:hypothetical protein [Pseudomonadota bacterium]